VRMPDEVWRWYLYRRTICRRAPANPGHTALVDLEQHLGDRFTLVTQNVDGLHLRAGSSLARTLQIHGNIDFHRWPAPEGPHSGLLPEGVGEIERDDPLTDETRALLRGPDGSRSRPHVLWFDESYDEPRFRADSALRAAQAAELLVVVGTAGATNLPLQIAAVARGRGIPIVDVNLDPDNPFAVAAAQSTGAALTGTAAELLPRLRDALLG
jgi:NAD-dependent deacetylase